MHVGTVCTNKSLQVQPMQNTVEMSPFPSFVSMKGTDAFVGPSGPHLSDSSQILMQAALTLEAHKQLAAQPRGFNILSQSPNVRLHASYIHLCVHL